MIDLDDVCITNTNRQLPALEGEYGRPKVEVLADRVRAIQPECRVEAVSEFFTESTAEHLLTGEQVHTCSAYLTFVAVDREGNRIPIAPVIPETEEEKLRYEQAGERRAYRLAMRDRLKGSR